MPWCVVVGCRNNLKATKRAGKDVSYHIFPKNPQRRSAWINILNRQNKFNANSSYICSDHFVPDDYECNSLKEELLNIKVKRQLKKNAVPSVNICNYSNEELLNTPINLLDSQNTNQTVNTCSRVKNTQPSCDVPMCNSTSSTSENTMILFHRLPSDTKLLKEWLNFCNIHEGSPSKYPNIVICSKHFNEESYELKYTTKSAIPTKTLKSTAVPTTNCELRITDCKSLEVIERKKLVDKLLADYDEQQKNESHLNNTVTKYPTFFSPKINSNAKLGDKLKLLKAINNSENYSPPKKRKVSISTNPNAHNVQQPNFNNLSQNKDQVIQVSAVKGGLMLHALPQVPNELKTTFSVKRSTGEVDESEEIIIVTKDEAANHVDLSSYKKQHKEKNTEIIVVTNLKEAENSSRHIEKSLLKNNSTQISNNNSYFKCSERNQVVNSGNDTPLYSAKVSLSEEKGCQVSFPCKGCEHRSLKINKLLRERTRYMKDLNQNGTWKDPDEVNTLKKMNGVLSLLLMQCVGEKNGKKSSPIRIDLVQDSIEKVDRDWSMQDTSETLCEALSVNAYDEFARRFHIINEI